MIKELIKAVILILFLLGVMLLIGSCGTRRMNQTKDIERVNVQSTAVDKEHSTLSSSVRMYEAREVESESSEVYDNETITETFTIGSDGKPYLSGRTTERNKGSKSVKGSEKSEAATEETTDQTIESEKKTKVDFNKVEKNTQKQTEADKTFSANLGWWGIVLAAILIVILFIAKKKLIKL